jgi:ribokinase
MRDADIVSIGGIATDVIMELPELPAPGRCVSASTLAIGIGGRGANQAVAAARLGGAVALVGAVGTDDAGVSLLARLASEGVDTRFVQRVPDLATGAFVMQRSPAGAGLAAVYRGANASVGRDLIDAAAASIRNARIVLVQLEIPLETVAYAISIANGGGARILLDPAPIRALPPKLLSAVAIVKANAGEAGALTGVDVTDLATAREAAARLLAMGVQLAVIEAGGAGNLFRTIDEEVFLPLYDVASVDTTGAGDALAGALAVALAEAQPLRTAAAFATAAAALATRRHGAQAAMPRRDEIEELLTRSAPRGTSA